MPLGIDNKFPRSHEWLLGPQPCSCVSGGLDESCLVPAQPFQDPSHLYNAYGVMHVVICNAQNVLPYDGGADSGRRGCWGQQAAKHSILCASKVVCRATFNLSILAPDLTSILCSYPAQLFVLNSLSGSAVTTRTCRVRYH